MWVWLVTLILLRGLSVRLDLIFINRMRQQLQGSAQTLIEHWVNFTQKDMAQTALQHKCAVATRAELEIRMPFAYGGDNEVYFWRFAFYFLSELHPVHVGPRMVDEHQIGLHPI